jgi:hypothetical protein
MSGFHALLLVLVGEGVDVFVIRRELGADAQLARPDAVLVSKFGRDLLDVAEGLARGDPNVGPQLQEELQPWG